MTNQENKKSKFTYIEIGTAFFLIGILVITMTNIVSRKNESNDYVVAQSEALCEKTAEQKEYPFWQVTYRSNVFSGIKATCMLSKVEKGEPDESITIVIPEKGEFEFNKTKS